MRRMYSQKQIERFAEIVANRVIEQGINLENIYTSDEHNGYLLMTDEGAIVETNPESLDLKVNTIEQSEANITDTDAFEFPVGMENINGYKALKVINGVLWLILSISFTTSAEYVAGGSPAFNVKIPSSLRSKIYDVNGKTMEDAVAGNTDIFSFSYSRLAGGQINTASARLQNLQGSEPRTKLLLQFYSTGWQASQNNNAVFVRIPLLII